jgi:teichuronic acid biosynthesis glycosyltransferase TuaC
MKVLFISNLFPDQSEANRGLDNAVILRHLSAFENTRIRAIGLRPRFSLLLSGSTADLTACAEDEQLSPQFQHIPYVPKVGGPWNAKLTARYLRGILLEELTHHPADVILVSWLFPDAAAIVTACKALGITTPVVMIAQGSDVHAYLRSATRKQQILEAIRAPQVGKVITRSKKLGELLVQAGADPSKVITIYNGVDTSLFRPSDTPSQVPPASPRFITVGNLLPVKNQSMLIEALALINRKRVSKGSPPAQLTIIGKGPLRTNLETLARDLGQSENVEFTGSLPPDQVAEAMRSADHFCMTSLNEGFPNVLLEAMACALLVTSTDVGGIAELIGEYPAGQLVPCADTEAMARAMETPFAAPGHPRATNPAVKEWTSVAREYSRILRNAVTRSPGGDDEQVETL